jgi:hypothetical protein
MAEGGKTTVFNANDVQARVQRLEQLARGLSKEVSLWREGNDPLLYLERRAYMNAMQDALAGVESARVVLAEVLQRLGPSPPPASQVAG